MRANRVLLTNVLLIGMAAPCVAQTAGMVSFQGLIRSTATGNPPITTPVSLEFRIFNADTGGAQVDMDGDGTVENTAAAPGAGTDTILVGPLTPNGGIVSTKFGPVSPKAFAGCTPGVAGCRWLEVTVVGSATPLSRIEMIAPPGAAEQVNAALSGNQSIVTDSSGRVGIGTSTPNFDALLSVSRAPLMDTAKPALALQGLYEGNLGCQGGIRANGLQQTNGPYEGGISLQRHYFDGQFYRFQDVLNLTASGNVGIGTTAPTALLHINQGPNWTSHSWKRCLALSEQGAIDFGQDAAGTRFGIGSSLDKLWFFSTTTEGTGAAPQHRLVIDSAGNVGIGTTNPGARLHVASNAGSQGGVRISHIDAGPTALGSNTISGISFRSNGSDPSATTFSELKLSGSHSQTGYALQSSLSTNDAGSPANLLLQPLFGKVGIGTPNPGAKLHVVDSSLPLQLESGVPNGDVPLRFSNSADARAWDLRYFNPGSGLGIYDVTNARWSLACDSNGRVGIGTTTPMHKLDVGGIGTDATPVIIRAKAVLTPWAGAFGGSDSTVMLGDFGGVAQIGGHNGVLGAWSNLAINSGGGNVGIGTTTPGAKLDVVGNMLVSGVPCCASDAQFKKNIVNVGSALGRMLSLRGVWFQWKDPAKHGDEARRQMGMIAQEVEKVLPEWVMTDAKGYRYLNTTGFPALAVEAIREMKNENDALKSQVSALEDRLARLERAIGDKSDGPTDSERQE